MGTVTRKVNTGKDIEEVSESNIGFN